MFDRVQIFLEITDFESMNGNVPFMKLIFKISARFVCHLGRFMKAQPPNVEKMRRQLNENLLLA